MKRLAVLGLVVALWGCAPTAQAPVSPAAPPAKGAVQATAPGTTTGRPVMRAAADSLPSPEALEVLKSIPEPLTPEETVPPPERVAPDSTAGDTTGDVPVPEPTAPLGEGRTAPPPAMPAGGAVIPPPANPPVATPSTSTSDSCWRVQVGAPTEKAKADQLRETAESLLLVPMVVEPEKGRYKVRSKDCIDGESADRLKQRALNSGLSGAFRFASAKR